MNKTQLIQAIAEKSGLTKTQATTALNAFEDSITEVLKSGNDVSILGFGTFSVKERAARTGRNPATGEPLEIKASKQPSFKAGKGLKDAVK
ncbi:HU family DNA-binding protein [Acinetobacter sp. B5B]|uniref:HU family DNA-binding protein n=1 Tax=Acinetobacter baretiae TaxID=2605383 RepID=UPI0018C34B26|nr:HU family DNA-binding protein [Acinetobacter baretiae]MBF7683938.1 HU family DNA-binding protein [Acinetobacter baretiae]